MTVIRAKVQVAEHKRYHWTQGQTEIVMRPVHAGAEIPEALQYASATPSGEIRLLMVDRAAAHFPLGKFFNVDFSEIDAQ